MKWTVQELIKLQNIDNTFKEIIDFSSYIDNTDIIDISPVEVEGDFEIYDSSIFEFYIEIKCTLTLACAITLEEVLYELNFNVEEIFSAEKSEEYTLIDGITIDLLPIIWSNIILEKPMRVLSENAYKNYQSEITESEDDDGVNRAFANLKNYRK